MAGEVHKKWLVDFLGKFDGLFQVIEHAESMGFVFDSDLGIDALSLADLVVDRAFFCELMRQQLHPDFAVGLRL